VILPASIIAGRSFDFVSDAQSDGWLFRILRIIDDFGRECLPGSWIPRWALCESRDSWSG